MAVWRCHPERAIIVLLMAGVKSSRSKRSAGIVGFTCLGIVGMLMVGATHGAIGANARTWYPITLETGETDGYQWAVGAKLPQHKPLGEICAMVSLLEPYEPDSPELEGRDSVMCGRLVKTTDSVTGNSSFGSGESRLIVFTALFRPAVRKVAFRIDGMGTRVFRPRIARVPNRQSRGIPRFRYFAASFRGETCIRKVTLFNGSGDVIYSESRPSCGGSGNL